MDNKEIAKVEEKKPSPRRYVALMQYKNERRGAEILNQLPQSKLELKAIYLDCLERAGLEYDGTRLVDIFYIDKKAVETIYLWTNFQCSVANVYADCISAWLNDPKEHPYAKPGDTYKGSFNDFIKPEDFTEYTA
jgi:hypothetical protein